MLRFEINFRTFERVRFASVLLLEVSNAQGPVSTYCRMCSLRFDIEENTIIEAFLRFRIASVNCVNYFGNIAKSWCTSMNLNKYYGYVYVSADNGKSKYELSKISEPNEITSL